MRKGDTVPIDKDFLRIAHDAFNPFTPFSGTEHVAWLLYSLVKQTRPKVVVEYGAGYTTLFLLAALAENASDVKQEAVLLREKTRELGNLQNLDLTSSGLKIAEWFGKGANACGVDP